MKRILTLNSNKLKEKISFNLKDEIFVEQKILSNPRIKIPGIRIENSISNSDLKQRIMVQNDVNHEKDLFEIEHIKYATFEKTHTLIVKDKI